MNPKELNQLKNWENVLRGKAVSGDLSEEQKLAQAVREYAKRQQELTSDKQPDHYIDETRVLLSEKIAAELKNNTDPQSIGDKILLCYINLGIFLYRTFTFLWKKILALFGILLVIIVAGKGVMRLPLSETALLFRTSDEVADAARSSVSTTSKAPLKSGQNLTNSEEPHPSNDIFPSITISVSSFQVALNTLDNISQDSFPLFLTYNQSHPLFSEPSPAIDHTTHVSFFLYSSDDKVQEKLLSEYNIPKDSNVTYIEVVTNTNSPVQEQPQNNQALTAQSRKVNKPTHTILPHFIRVSTPQQIQSTIEGISNQGYIIYNVQHRMSVTNDTQLRSVTFDLGPHILTGNSWQLKSYNLPSRYQGRVHLELAN